MSRDLNLDFNNADFNSCDNECFVDMSYGFMVLCWFSHQAQLQRGILSTGMGESLWLGMMAEYFRSETTFSRSEPPFPPPFPQVWQKQCGDFHRYGPFCLKVPEEFLPFLSQISAGVSVPFISWLCWCDNLSTQWGHGLLFKEKYPWLHHPKRNHTQIEGMLLLAEPMG